MEGLPDSLPELDLEILPELASLGEPWSSFSIPKLEDKPQNPIIKTLERNIGAKVPNESTIYAPDDVPFLDVEKKDREEHQTDIWLDAKKAKNNHKVVSWDTMRSTSYHPHVPSPFITEQQPDFTIAARNSTHLLSSCFKDDSTRIKVVDLFGALGSILSGCATVFHDWDTNEERFDPIRVHGSDEQLRLVIEGLDGTASDSYISQFLEFGTYYRRLETLAMNLRKTNREMNATVFAFAHALSAVLTWIKTEISHLLLGAGNSVCGVWVSFQDVRSVLTGLASLCHRDLEFGPKSYEQLPWTPQRLLSRIYDFLSAMTERQAPRLVRAVLAYVLTITSRPYLSDLEKSVGLVGLEEKLAEARRRAFKAGGDDVLVNEQEYNGDVDSELELENDMKEDFPSFMSDNLRDTIIRARRSIRILSSPEFESSSISDLPGFQRLKWMWTDKEVTCHALNYGSEEPSPPGVHWNQYKHALEVPVEKYKPELAQFAYFDLEPGSLTGTTNQDVVNFIASFPTHPPVLATTLPLLAECCFSPIVAQANVLGRTALQRFLTTGTALHFRAHLVLLRAYLLLQAPSFKARLSAALFSDAEAEDDMDESAEENQMAITIRTRARNANYRAVRERSDQVGPRREQNNQPWAVGLAFGLTERAQWPPGGSDLSFYLRRVIMDSLEHVRDSENMFTDDEHKGELGDDEFWDEAENRLGFAIRDLPIGTGREKWLDPTLIEALDFLYMEYRPPASLRCLITADIVSKYQRVFAFLLRLLRVETSMRLVFRLTRPHAVDSVFADYPDTQTLVLHFRFAAQTFVSVLSAYVADTAIRGNVDAFIARVHYAEVLAASETDDDSNVGPFSDVYTLMQRHSRTLDAVLSACLLRGSQKAVGDILRALLEVILEFAVLVGNVYRSGISTIRREGLDEEKAARRVEALYAKFCKTRDGLVKALRKIKERGSKPFALEGSNRPHEGLPAPSGGTEALSDLLLRLAELKDERK